MKKTIGIVGGGPAGIMAAITARHQGAQVTILERNDRIGKKILSTGNGKCNLGNLNLTEKEYYGSSPEWISQCLKRFGTEETIQFFRSLGLFVKSKNGYLYPACEQASVVLDVLRIELRALGVQVITDCKINHIKRIQAESEYQFEVCAGERAYRFDRVILACGGKAAPKTGSDGSGYKLASQLKHGLIPTVPALVQLKCGEDYLKSVSGVRAEGRVTLFCDGREAACEQGEVQFTDYGISGIPVFQLSRTANYILREGSAATVRINLLPNYTEEEYRRMADERIQLFGERTVEEFFTGIVNKKLLQLFIKLSGLKSGWLVKEADKKEIAHVFYLLQCWDLHVTGSNSYDSAQVCAGGVPTGEVTPDMESKKAPGVFFAGEILDVDGKCGGYNLQWAWCSGYLAGMAAVK